ncbi:MAG: hypothetical protein KF739_08110 [Cryobacterium sp.]|nr:hypothetical protein [Cryobacterium sp.]
MRTKKSWPLSMTALTVGLLLTATACTPGTDNTKGDNKVENVDFVWVVPALPASADPATGGPLPRVIGPERAGLPVAYDLAKVSGAGCEQLAPISDLAPDLVESWEFNSDRTELTLTLRKGVKSAAGNELTSDDFVWSLERSVAESPTAKRFLQTTTLWRANDPVEAINEHEVVIHIATPGALDVAHFTMFSWLIFDSTEAKTHATAEDPWAKDWLSSNSANFGPWTFTSEDWDPSQKLVLHRNPNYYAPEQFGNIGRLIIQAVPDGSTRSQLASTGKVGLATDLAPQDLKHLDGVDDVQVLNCASANRDTLILNQAFEPFADVRVRQAVSMAIDRVDLNQAAYLGLADPSTDGLSQAYSFPTPATRLTYDVAGAKKLMAEAGYADGFAITITYSPSRPGPQAEQIALNLQKQLAAININVELKQVATGTQFSSDFQDGNYQAMVYQEPPAIADPQYSAALYNYCDSFQNTFGYCNEKYDDLTDKIRTTSAGPERDKLVSQLSSVSAETIPVVYLLDTRAQYALNGAVDLSTVRQQPGNRLELWRVVMD